jgi:hypothetical protein
LLRVDKPLHDFIARIVDRDPLQGPRRAELLQAAVDVALRCGRPEDAVVAASMLAEGPVRTATLLRAEAALRIATAW